VSAARGNVEKPWEGYVLAVEKDNFTVLVACADTSARERWRAALDALVCLQQAVGLRQAEQLLSAQRVDLIVLDSGLLGGTVAESLARLTVNVPDVRVLLMDKGIQDADRVAAIKVGVVGYCDFNAPASTVLKAVTAIRNGEVWLPRALIAQLIDTFSIDALSGVENALSEEQHQSLCSLTAREFEVARLVHQSANNKVIARALNISERTVKAHLSAIFKKLGVANRVRLALLFKEIT
jgi:two-component system nitrate/nitrite response regulator NarL